MLAALGQLAEPAVKDAYEAVKALIVRKFGKASDVVKAVEAVEAKPDSAGRQTTLTEEMASSGAARDGELLQLAQALLEKSRSTQGGTHTVRFRSLTVQHRTSWEIIEYLRQGYADWLLVPFERLSTPLSVPAAPSVRRVRVVQTI